MHMEINTNNENELYSIPLYQHKQLFIRLMIIFSDNFLFAFKTYGSSMMQTEEGKKHHNEIVTCAFTAQSITNTAETLRQACTLWS